MLREDDRSYGKRVLFLLGKTWNGRIFFAWNHGMLEFPISGIRSGKLMLSELKVEKKSTVEENVFFLPRI